MRNTYTVDMVTRVYIEADTADEAHEIATKAFFTANPCGEYTNAQTRQGVWHLFAVGDDTDNQVWNPYTATGDHMEGRP